MKTPVEQGRARTSIQAMKTPGCYVVSKEIENGRPKLFGRLTVFDASSDKVVVVSSAAHHLMGNPKTVWEGTVEEYFDMWRCN